MGDTDQSSAAGRRTNISLGPWAPSRGLDTHSQSVIQEGTSKDTSMSITVCEEDTKMPSQDVRRKPVCEAAMLDEV